MFNLQPPRHISILPESGHELRNHDVRLNSCVLVPLQWHHHKKEPQQGRLGLLELPQLRLLSRAAGVSGMGCCPAWPRLL
jgi:hypothetical protein